MNYNATFPVERVTTGFVPSPFLINRIKASYRVALQRAPTPEDSFLWSMIGSKQLDVHEALMSDGGALMDLLSDPQKTDLYYGVDILAKGIMAMMDNDTWIEDRWKNGERLHSMLEDLVVSLGGRILFNPEGGANYPYKTKPSSDPVDKCFDFIQQEMGTQLNFPNPFAGEFGLVTSKGIVTERAVQAIYQALLIRRHSGNTCLEIGGGMGRTAYYAHQLGIRYSIIDLPMTIVGQALFLSATLGEDAIWMIGDSEPRGNRVALLPPSELHAIGPVDVVLNVDSLTEMGEKTASGYVEWISKNAGTFLSINHEANHFTVKQVIDKSYPDSARSRHLYWLRAGYVEEVFSFRQDNSKEMLASVLQSTSWRMTEPLRKLVTLFR
ncbi:putative sugar O-methyltransferase [Phyllobacterium lublinensis]|uniref:putative sugar O-methyltransferase n=1 Tax=Phyllobacterium lublinensis TaxID=2875708 RepID=UPI001CCBD33F|nr:putative sugar O-methyltransferase [Phyllobacterium sp. 2063]MBZ9656085.1 putative sugar O-methyltransferase [Phyllobacterium sp. 2063]